MKSTLTLLLALFLPVFAHAKPLPAASNPVPVVVDEQQTQAPKLSARAYLLYDHSSKQILLEQNSHERSEPASLTKLMTAYLTFDAIRQGRLSLNDKVTPSTRPYAHNLQNPDYSSTVIKP